jgi:hypothetical protein
LSINDIQTIVMKGDNLEGFQDMWEYALAGMTSVPHKDVLEHCYYQQLRGYRGLSEEIAHYNRHDRGHPDHTYEFLVKSVEKHLARARRLGNREAQTRSLAGVQPTRNAAPGTPYSPRQPEKPRPTSRDPAEGSNDPTLRVCRYYLKGECNKGEECKFSHDSGYTPRSMESGSDKSQITCKFFIAGHCKKGTGCDMSHSGKPEGNVPTPGKDKNGRRARSPSPHPARKPKSEEKPKDAGPALLYVQEPDTFYRPEKRVKFPDDAVEYYGAPRGWNPTHPRKGVVDVAASIGVPSNRVRPRKWLADTGCPYDLVSKKGLSRREMSHIYEGGNSVSLQTANGIKRAQEVIPMQIAALPSEQTVTPYVLESTPDVLSLGYRCQKMGYGLIWEPFSSSPKLISPARSELPAQDNAYEAFMLEKYGEDERPDVTEMVTENYCPYIIDYDYLDADDERVPAMPATSEGEATGQLRSCLKKGTGLLRSCLKRNVRKNELVEADSEESDASH